MTADFSRNSFRAKEGFSAVRLQQGRVQMDADWNEQVDIVNALVRQTTADLIGSAGAPIPGGGFELVVRNSLALNGRGFADTAPTTAFNIGNRKEFRTEVVLATKDDTAQGVVLALIDNLGQTWFELEVGEQGQLKVTRGTGSTNLESEPLSWDRQHHIEAVYDGQNLSLTVDGQRLC